MNAPKPARTLFTPTVVMALLAVTAMLALTGSGTLFRSFGFDLPDRWFLDSYALLAASDAAAAGLDVEAPNPLDPLQRPHSYSDWWLGLRFLGLTRDHNFLLGGSWVLAYLAVAVALLRPRNWREAALGAAVIVAPPMLLAVQRANNDLSIFILLGLAGLAWRADSVLRVGLSAGVIALATGLKYYPVAAAAVLLLIEPPARRGWLGALLGLGIVAAFASVADTMGRGMFGLVIDIHKTGLPILPHDLGFDGRLVRPVGALLLAAAGWALARGRVTRGLAGSDPGSARALFVIGATVSLACFVAGLSHAYRLVLLLPVLPWLWRGPAAATRAARLAAILVVAVTWLDGLMGLAFNTALRAGVAFDVGAWLRGGRLLIQPLHWALMALLAGWLAELGLAVGRDWLASLRRSRWLGPRAVFGLATLALLAGLGGSARMRAALGFADGGPAFLDSYAILATLDAARAGISPDAPNPYDPLLRNHKYSDWWLGLGSLGLTRADNFWFGAACGGLFLAAVLLTVRPRSIAEALWLALLAGSPPVAFALVRANNDLIIFGVLAGAVAAWRSTPAAWRDALAVAAIAVATGLKFYPAAAAAAVIVLRPMRRLAGVALGLMAIVGVVLLLVGGQMTRGTFNVQPGVHVVGARLWFHDLGLPEGAALAASVAAFVAGAWLLRGAHAPRETSTGDLTMFAVAAAVLAACFLAGLSFSYRLIFAIWLGPWLWAEAARGDGACSVTLARLGLWLLPAVLWSDGLLCLAINVLWPTLTLDQVLKTEHLWRLATQPLIWALMLGLGGWLGGAVVAAWRSRQEPAASG